MAEPKCLKRKTVKGTSKFWKIHVHLRLAVKTYQLA